MLLCESKGRIGSASGPPGLISVWELSPTASTDRPGEFEGMSDDELLDVLHERFGDGETQH